MINVIVMLSQQSVRYGVIAGGLIVPLIVHKYEGETFVLLASSMDIEQKVHIYRRYIFSLEIIGQD